MGLQSRPNKEKPKWKISLFYFVKIKTVALTNDDFQLQQIAFVMLTLKRFEDFYKAKHSLHQIELDVKLY